jgi:hypothetical protein
MKFNFSTTAEADKTKDDIVALFEANGCGVASAELDPRTSRVAGISFRQIHLVFADSQTVDLKVKLSGEVLQVLLNRKPVALRQQDEPDEAVKELAELLDMGRVAWQRRLTRLRATGLEPGKRVLSSMALEERRLLGRIAEKSQVAADGREQLAQIRAQISAAASAP